MSAEGRAKVLIKVTLLAAAVTVAGLDQITKAIARSSLASGGIAVMPGWLDLQLSENSGGAFGLFSGGRVVFLAAVSVLVIGVLATMGRIERRSTALALGILLGGALGNAIDRIFADGGFVTDFIRFRWWPSFNVADIGIVVGSFLVALIIWRRPVERTDPVPVTETEAGP
ncbi:MAG: signal peptidase II [Acidobacteria bacterium]|nr:MAG: signal peptidase II [Acidobacteriota bacterium]